MKKKLLALGLTFAMVFSMAACGGDDGGDASAKTSIVIYDGEWYGLDTYQLSSTAGAQTLNSSSLFQWDPETNTVEDNVCTIKLNEKANLEKKLVEYDLDKHQVTLQLKVNNAAEAKIPSGEMMLVIDSSNSMDQKVDDNTTRKELVLNSANKLVESLLKANPTTLKIGVVTFSTSSQKDENGNLIIGTEADAQKVCDFTNNVQKLKSKIYSIEGTGQYTNLDSCLKLAKSQYTSEDNNK